MSKLALRLYELTLDNGRSSSPFVWRIRYALAHKGLPYELIGAGFTDIPAMLKGRFKTVPVLGVDDAMIGDSWDIALYLDQAFPGTPALFSSPAEIAAVHLCDEWQASALMRKLYACYALDIHNAARPVDQPYFRQSREKQLKGKTLEEFVADRVAQLPETRAALAPWRKQLTRSPFLGGSTPTYVDYMALGAFQWVASVSTLPLLEADDPLRDYIDRGFALYDGKFRDPRMKPLFE